MQYEISKDRQRPALLLKSVSQHAARSSNYVHGWDLNIPMAKLIPSLGIRRLIESQLPTRHLDVSTQPSSRAKGGCHRLPRSLAPWHTLPFLSREAQKAASTASRAVGSTIMRARGAVLDVRENARARRATRKLEGCRDGALFRLPWRRHEPECKRHLPSAAEDAASLGFQLQRKCDVHGAITAYQEAVRLCPGNAIYLSCLSKQWSDSVFMPGTSDEEARSHSLKAMELAQQAVNADPSCSLAHVATCVSKGRLTYFVNNKRKLELAREARRDAHTALSFDENSDLAYHVLGRWHTEMAQVNFVVRAMIRVMYGAALEPGSHREAAAAYERAVELAPARLVHRVELGRALLYLRQPQQAYTQLQAAMDLDIEDINAHLTRKDGENMLSKLQQYSTTTSSSETVDAHTPHNATLQQPPGLPHDNRK